MIAAVKFIHFVGLACWCAALIALPLLMHAHGGMRDQRQFARFRLVTHVSYIAFATPAALIAIAAGTALVFLARVFEPWLLAKLAVVAAMVLVHVWLGHLIQRSGEQPGRARPAHPLVGLALALPLIGVVLALVLTKPDLSALTALIPDQFLVPRGAAP